MLEKEAQMYISVTKKTQLPIFSDVCWIVSTVVYVLLTCGLHFSLIFILQVKQKALVICSEQDRIICYKQILVSFKLLLNSYGFNQISLCLK